LSAQNRMGNGTSREKQEFTVPRVLIWLLLPAPRLGRRRGACMYRYVVLPVGSSGGRAFLSDEDIIWDFTFELTKVYIQGNIFIIFLVCRQIV
jgi:hypothetical protein